MQTFESFKPQLKSGRISFLGSNLIFETDTTYEQIVLPIEALDLLTQCNGQLTITEIIQNIYRKKGTLQFKLILNTILELKNKRLLENADQIEASLTKEVDISADDYYTFPPLFKSFLARRILNEKSRPMAFYLASLLIIVAGILSLQNISRDWFNFSFLNMSSSYTKSLAFLFISASLLLTAKNIYKAFLQLLLTGRTYNISLIFNGFALYVKTENDSLLLVKNKLFLVLYNAAIFFSCVSFIFLSELAGWPISIEYYSVAVILALLDLNPYQANDFTYYFCQIMQNDNINRLYKYLENKPLISILTNYKSQFKQAKNKIVSALVFYSVVWTALSLTVLTIAISYHFPALWLIIKSHDSITEKFSALVSISSLLGLTLILSYNLLRLFNISILIRKLKEFLLQNKNQTISGISAQKSRALEAQIKNIYLLSQMSDEFIHNLTQNLEIIEVPKGRSLNSISHEKYPIALLLLGEVHVDGALFTSPQLLTELFNWSEAKTNESCIVALLDSVALLKIKENSFQREVESFNNSLLVRQYLSNTPFFKTLSEDLKQMFFNKGLIESYKPDQTIFNQNDHADGFYLLLSGDVRVLVDNYEISRITAGGFFGEVSMIADIPRTATIIASHESKVLRISKEAFWQILSYDISIAVFIESVGEMRVREDIDLLKSA